MALRRITTPGAGIPGISPAILIEGGRVLLLSGHTPIDEAGTVVKGGLEEQMERCFKNMNDTLAAAGADFSNVARLTIYVRDYTVEHLPIIRSVRDRWVDRETPPASALIGVAALFAPDVLVELDAVAAV